MKKFFIYLFSLIFILNSFSSCNDRDNINFEKVYDLENLEKDPDFIKLVENLDQFSKLDYDIDLMKEIQIKSKVSENDKLLFAKSLGFSSIEEAENFEKSNFTYITRLYQNFQLDRFDKESLLDIFIDALQRKNENNVLLYKGGGHDCEEQRDNCRKGSTGIYMVEMAGCVPAGVSVDTASFYCAGCAGAGLWAFCATGASMHYRSMLDDCEYEYRICKRKLN